MLYKKQNLIDWLHAHKGDAAARDASEAWADDDSYSSLSEALLHGFKWDGSKLMSLAYWRTVYAELVKSEVLAHFTEVDKLRFLGLVMDESDELRAGDTVADMAETSSRLSRKGQTPPSRPTGRLGRILELREEIARRRGEKVARVYDDKFRYEVSAGLDNAPLSLFLDVTLLWGGTGICETPYASSLYWRKLQNELKAAGL